VPDGDLLGKNPSVAGTSSTASNTGSGSAGESDQDEASSSSDEFDFLEDRKEADVCEPDGVMQRINSSNQCINNAVFDKESKASNESSNNLSFNMMFKSTEEQYGFGLHQPEQNDYDLYKSYVSIGEHACKPSSATLSSTQAITTSNMFSILTNSVTESISRDTLSIDIASNRPNKSDRLHIGSNPKIANLQAKISTGSYEFSPDFYGHYLPRNNEYDSNKNETRNEFNIKFNSDFIGEDTKLYEEYIERGKTAKASVNKDDLDLYMKWVNVYNTAVTTPNKLNPEDKTKIT
jgi:hypothetical protein